MLLQHRKKNTLWTATFGIIYTFDVCKLSLGIEYYVNYTIILCNCKEYKTHLIVMLYAYVTFNRNYNLQIFIQDINIQKRPHVMSY